MTAPPCAMDCRSYVAHECGCRYRLDHSGECSLVLAGERSWSDAEIAEREGVSRQAITASVALALEKIGPRLAWALNRDGGAISGAHLFVAKRSVAWGDDEAA
jgi:hypothetical protein